MKGTVGVITTDPKFKVLHYPILKFTTVHFSYLMIINKEYIVVFLDKFYTFI